ncbi:TolC family protein [Mucilaginibacter gotjawali]|uniref:Outer membrane efflux protein BepC n=2 Tax=Mucilaginibacter gotjawali TaxID=1550579 RepID=A0A120MY06_9SPHI|nr:TolC family protein [Mucilaginibacter gotjawali]MBB3057870.1 outer membrane protein [Mucilaginibacter gotjawali]BAU52358.1 Outer membrane efflux protein BepC precursor [Mucilaginibacter gotjawali]
MPLKPKFLLSLVLLLACFNNLFAQDSTLMGTTINWDLAKCIDYAKKNNILINTYRLSLLTSQQQYLLAKAARLPNLSGSATQNFSHQNAGSYDPATGTGGGSGLSASGSYSLNSSVTLYNGNLINNTIQQANLSVESANLSIIQQENDITLQITQAYLAVLLDKENIIYDTDLVNTSATQVKLEQQKYDVGAVARYALIQLQAQQSTDQFTLINAKNTEKGDLLTLKQLLLLTSDVNFDIIKPDTIVPIDTVTAFKTVEQTALQNRPEVKSSELGVKIAQYGVDIAKAGYKPVLSAGGALNTSYSTGQGSLPYQLNNNFNQEVGLTLSVPIFTRRVVKTQVEEAKINVDQADLNLKNTRITLSQSVERAYLNVTNAKSQYDAALQQYNFNKEGYRIATEQLKVGAINTVDYSVQKNLFIQAQQAFIQAKYNELLTLKIYDFYRGIPIKL